MSPARIEAVFLDLGNVLVFHDDDVLFGRLAARARSTPERVRDAVLALWRPIHLGAIAGADLVRALSEAIGADLSPAEFEALWNGHFRVHHDVMPLVESLLGRTRIFLLSNTNESHFEFVRPSLPILRRFDGLLLSYEIGACKPDPAIFEAALRRAGVPAPAAAFFDDVPAYVDAARALGIEARLFTDAARFRSDLAALGLAR